MWQVKYVYAQGIAVVKIVYFSQQDPTTVFDRNSNIWRIYFIPE